MPVTDSHYLHASLSDTVLGAYYLGCPMADAVKRAYADLHKAQSLSLEEQMQLAVLKVGVLYIYMYIFMYAYLTMGYVYIYTHIYRRTWW